ncbi:hypothetical protein CHINAEXTREME_05100 [Halobiforma lacisalsi AJ5]|uniref:Uncharacterized protein n=1 Tax=Natronobacterium lacisalsi AJ5 TaxID=358396 RepID=M0LK91_NATLA|nr:hypothetical protein [Halobiforma lacisalsi]APW97184.1 hypothetical protein CHINAEXTREME_05100 [Halobiforma lacisalsi AJ5]EMA34017.1 hypothetical protein C445_08367 [Halobiforma lacisalsi AJ5]
MYEKPIGRPQRDPFDALVDVLAAADRYDLLLGIVPVAFAVALVVAGVASLSMAQALLVAATIGVLVIVDACYRNPPTDQGST